MSDILSDVYDFIIFINKFVNFYICKYYLVINDITYRAYTIGPIDYMIYV